MTTQERQIANFQFNNYFIFLLEGMFGKSKKKNGFISCTLTLTKDFKINKK